MAKDKQNNSSVGDHADHHEEDSDDDSSSSSRSEDKQEQQQGWWSWTKELVFCHLCLAVIFVTTGLIVDFVQLVMFLLIKPWNPTLFRTINYYVTYTLNAHIVFLVEWWSGTRVKLYADPAIVDTYFGNEHALLLLNHCYETDWLVGWVICERSRILGNARVYAKRVLQYAPVLGWSWKFQEMIFLERNWEKDKESLGQQISCLCQFPQPFWLCMFPEGTRYTKAKHEASMIIAREKGLPELKHHLLPRTRGFVGSIPHLKKGGVPAIYDVTVGFKKNSRPEPTVFNLLNGKALDSCLLMRRIPLTDVPDDPEEMAAWLQRHYQHKDKVLGNYLETGDFNPKNDLPEYKNFKYFEQPRRYFSLINMMVWGLIILFALCNYLIPFFTSGSYYLIGFGLGLLAAAYYGMYKLIGLTKINKSASSYGQKNSSSSYSPARVNTPDNKSSPVSVTAAVTNGVEKKGQ